MSKISEHIGNRIKLYRKIKDMTLEDLARKINKSAATLSKYQSGSIAVDIETLFEIAEALGCSLGQLTDYEAGEQARKKELPARTIFGDNDTLYMYFFDGVSRKIKFSMIQVKQNTIKNRLDATLYMNIQSHYEFHNFEHLYTGEFKPFDSISHFQFENQINNIEQLSLNIINPLNNSPTMTGLLTGISGHYLLPAATKAILSRNVLTMNSQLKEDLAFTKDELKILKNSNNLIIFRP